MRSSLQCLLSVFPAPISIRQRQKRQQMPKHKPVSLRTMRTRLHGRQLAQYASTKRQYVRLHSKKRRVTHRISHPCMHSRITALPPHSSRTCIRVHPYTPPTTMYDARHNGISPRLRAYTSAYLPTGMSYTYVSDSKVILVDNCCSTSITNDLRDFISPPRPTRAKVEGYNSTATATMVGTVRWKIHNDLGIEHQFYCPIRIILLRANINYYAPNIGCRLPKTIPPYHTVHGVLHMRTV